MTRDDILEAAAQIFSQKGFHAASMQDIAETVHLQKASLYHHFNSKQEILVALLDKALDLLINLLQEVVAQPLPANVKLSRAVHTYLHAMLEHRDLAVVLLLEHRSLDAAAAAHHIPLRDRFERLWRDLLMEGIRTGVFTCTSPSITGRALLGVMNWTITWYRPEGALSVDEVANEYSTLFLRGLMVRTDETPRMGIES